MLEVNSDNNKWFYDKKVSVIIPSTRLYFVPRTIRSIINQAYGDYEIIVVGKDVSSVLREEFFGSVVILIDCDTQCLPSQARNIGVLHAKGDVLLFIDDDCEAGPEWFKKSIELLADNSVGIITGKIIGKSKGFFAMCTDYACFYLQQGEKAKYLDKMCSVTFGMRKDLFDKIKGFDSRLRVREDIDLTRRVRSYGYSCLYNPQIEVFHYHERVSFKKMIKYQYKMGFFDKFLVTYKHTDDWKERLKVRFIKNYLLLVVPLALWATATALKENLKFNRKIFLYLPFIFISNISYQLGVLKWLRSQGN